MNQPRIFFSLVLLLPTSAPIPAPPAPEDAVGIVAHPCDVRAGAPPAGDARASGEVAPPPAAGEAEPVALPTPLSLGPRESFRRDTYLQAFEILKEDNSCSRFFGGPAKALHVLNGMTMRMEERRLPEKSVAIMMTGPYTLNVDNRTGARFRLFGKVTVNRDGPLYAGRGSVAKKMLFGRFRSDTERGRALALLHELGHLVRGGDGAWLLPDDGHNTQLSMRNTHVVEGRCLDQLLAIKE